MKKKFHPGRIDPWLDMAIEELILAGYSDQRMVKYFTDLLARDFPPEQRAAQRKRFLAEAEASTDDDDFLLAQESGHRPPKRLRENRFGGPREWAPGWALRATGKMAIARESPS